MSFENRAGSMKRVYRAGLVASISALAMVLATAPAFGDLSVTDLGAISTAVSSAVATPSPSSSAGTPSAPTQALTSLTTSSMGQYGPANGPTVASAIITDAVADGASPQSVGQAMGEAALAIGAPGSNDIAQAVGEDGDSEMLAAFDAAVAGAPGGAELQTVADNAGNKRQTNSSFGVNIGGGVVGAGGPSIGGGIALCVNPSCT